MTRLAVLGALGALAAAACGGASGDAGAHTAAPAMIPADAAVAVAEPLAAEPRDRADATAPVAAPPLEPEVWLRGSTHVHARPSGDSSTPIADVIAWYEAHHYDFIALTDHNEISEVEPHADTTGRVAVREGGGLIVLAGIELTHNPRGCVPAGDASGKCRIHVNLIGATARPGGKLDWAPRGTRDRVAKYAAALVAADTLGGIAQLDHPQWFWGMTPDVLVELAHRGMRLYEVANAQFVRWNAGDKEHPSTEALWDAALVRGATLWGVASDDAHDYGPAGGPYPAGGGWIMVKARREPQAILDAIAAGHFYASTGVTLARAGVDGTELVVEVAASDTAHVIDFIEGGHIVESVRTGTARRTLPATGYLRAVVTRGDGAKAWVQPARR